MKLEKINYISHQNKTQEWCLEDCTLDDINLVVGRNASGKTKVLGTIAKLARLLCGQEPPIGYANFKVVFDDDGQKIVYILEYEDEYVIKETLQQADNNLLKRKKSGEGKIFAVELNQDIVFKSPIDTLTVLSRRDEIQHPFLERLYQWGKSVKLFEFGVDMEQNPYRSPLGTMRLKSEAIKNGKMVFEIFEQGQSNYREKYINNIKADMKHIGYELEDIYTPEHLFSPTLFKPIVVKEKDLDTFTSQYEMSTGMFRALSLLIQVNYFLLASLPSCIIIDDIGEGLDYGRSTALIKLLIDKVKNTQVQLIMATNDQFVMDSVPLEYWSVIQRLPHQSKIYNYRNSKAVFDAFDFTGLSNFDFFSSNYFLKNEPTP